MQCATKTDDDDGAGAAATTMEEECNVPTSFFNSIEKHVSTYNIERAAQVSIRLGRRGRHRC